jgi:zinc transport system permease protein
MHGALLGGAIAIAAGIHPVVPTIAVGAVMVVLIGRVARRTRQNPGLIAMMLMTASIAAAALVVYRFDVPAKDTLSLIWGNVYALRPVDLAATVALAAVIVGFVLIGRSRILAVLFDAEIAYASGINEPAIHHAVLALVALTVAVAMRLVGALLLDVLLLLPALAARQIARSGAAYFAFACVGGVVTGASGFVLSLVADIPVSTAAAIPAILLICIGALANLRNKSTKRSSS